MGIENQTGAAAEAGCALSALPRAIDVAKLTALLGLIAAVAFACNARAADVIKGAQLYARHCASCHGVTGVPVMPGAPDLSRPESLMRPDGALLQAIRGGRTAMPGYQGVLRDSDILDVIAHMRTLLR